MDTQIELGRSPETENGGGFDLDRAVEEARKESEGGGDTLHITEDVVFEIARRALTRVTSVQPGNSGSSVLGLGRKTNDGVKVSLTEEDGRARITVDAYVLVRYGLRIPDVAWDLQEFLKNTLENTVGCEVKAVNIYVQGVFFADTAAQENSGAGVSEREAAPAAPAGD